MEPLVVRFANPILPPLADEIVSNGKIEGSSLRIEKSVEGWPYSSIRIQLELKSDSWGVATLDRRLPSWISEIIIDDSGACSPS